ncbi:TraB/GumN family protein [Neptunicella sp. SCSIO 80796]|uniref:TraB/GumN family protein n=1 Tax=Neptunicella plasticusilytica TaxID=3117012 RepID=UPI003A4D2AF8
MQKLFTLIIASAISFSALADSPVWQITNGNNKLYIGGTMHMLTQQDFPLPTAFDQAYEQAEILVFETDIGKLQSSEFQQLSMQLLTYQDGTTLRDILKPETLQKVEQHLQSRGMTLDTVIHFKPAFLALMLTVIEFRIMGLSNDGVDQYFYDRSDDEQKAHLYFETPRQQLEFLASLGEGQEDHYVLYSLEEINNVQQQLDSMRNQWRMGQFDSMAKELLIPMQRDFPSVYNNLILSRNNNWIPAIKHMLDTPETEMILVGALHLAGKNGVLQQLKDLGYQLTEVH